MAGLEADLLDDRCALLALVGPDRVLAATWLAEGGQVDVRPATAGVLLARITEPGGRTRSLGVSLQRNPSGRLANVSAACACPDPSPCRHAVAVVLRHLDGGGGDGPRVAPRPAPWQAELAFLLGEGAPTPSGTDPVIGLQFEVVPPGARSADLEGRGELLLRPVVRGGTGRWVRTGVSWSAIHVVSYGYSASGTAVSRTAPEHLDLLREVHTIATGTDRYAGYGYAVRGAILLHETSTRRVWDVLADAQAAGIPLLRSGSNAPTTVAAEPARVELTAARPGSDLQLRAQVTVGDRRPRADSCLFLGDPVHGIAWWGEDDADPGPGLWLARLAGPADRRILDLLGRTVEIPQADEARFLRDYLPALQRRHPVRPVHPGIDLPQVEPTALLLTVHGGPPDGLDLEWVWETGARGARLTEPLDAPLLGDRDGRQAAHRDEVLREVVAVLRSVPETAAELVGPAPRSAVHPRTHVRGLAMVAVAERLVPALRGLDNVRVELDAMPGFRQAQHPPSIEFVSRATGPTTDWFDLGITVTVDDEPVPFAPLFSALAEGEQVFVTVRGTCVRLDRPEFGRLAELIAESRTIHDAPPLTVRVGPHHGDVWHDLEDLGTVQGPAAGWSQRVRDGLDRLPTAPVPVPAGLAADLRPYQREGFAWLAALHATGLGGVLADDMGLGKTLQTLALICHVRDGAGDDAGPPFLVVAPASVAHTWAAEALRFAPGLRVAVVGGTARRRGVALADVARGADVVVTTYTLLRLEEEAYTDLDWGGLVLDEAQAVKNWRTSTYGALTEVSAPFRLAITGTPLENNLSELWALASLAAPGALGTLTRFTEFYRTPIEKAGDGDRLALLRRRLRPLMLRRTKAEVAPDLPDKQEQVLDVDLHPRHRAIYDRHLNRERQKVLGVLGDFDAHRFAVFRSLTLLRQASLAASLVDPAHEGVPSAKLDALVEIVGDLAQEGHRVLVFSQFTRFLRAARERLAAAGIGCVYLDGATRNRGQVVERFRQGDDPAFLISLKAGGTGLTLTEADYCVVLDPWWNPAAEAQAVDRAHRIGQTRKVNVYRLVARGTIEEKVMALKERKAALFQDVLGDGEFASAALTVEDIRGLLD